MRRNKLPFRVLRGDQRSLRRCCVRGCANVARTDAIICDVHAQALRPTPDGDAA